MLMKLLATKMVANSFLGLSSKLTSTFSFSESSPVVLKSEGFKENSATSEPEIKAEQASNTINNNMLNTCVKSITENKRKNWGSGSKIRVFN